MDFTGAIPRFFNRKQAMSKRPPRHGFSLIATSALFLPATIVLEVETAAAAEVQVSTRNGRLTGQLSSERNVTVFKGIRYALPPVGDRRWKPPAPPSAWTGVHSALRPGPACLQPPGAAGAFYTDPPPFMSEDCLYLNVWAPKNVKNAPVLVWLHGGALVMGSGSNPRYDGAKLAEKGVVVVTINYRLGIFGYFAHPGLSEESPNRASGNYGTLDQIAALRWVQQNISSFGGDPERVTLFGQSAGALSITHLMASPLATGLFQAAIAQSPYLPAIPDLKTAKFGQPSAEATGSAFGQRVEASSLSALRQMPANELLSAASEPTAPWRTTAVVDGWVLREQIFETFERGREAKVPLIAGFTSGEARAFGPGLVPVPANAASYEAQARAAYGHLASQFLRLYPAEHLRDSSLAAARDAFYGWAVEHLLSSHAKVAPTWMYYFDHEYPSAAARNLGAFHSIEVPFVFGNVGPGAVAPPNWPTAPGAAEDVAVSDDMMSYWVAFARSGSPAQTGRPAWPKFADPKGGYLAFRGGQALPSENLLPGMFEVQNSYMQRLRSNDQSWYWDNIGVAAKPLPSEN